MQSSAPNVVSYIQEAPTDRLPILTALRQLCLETLIGYAECMAYGMPGYGRDGVIEVGSPVRSSISRCIVSKPEILPQNTTTRREWLPACVVCCLRSSWPAVAAAPASDLERAFASAARGRCAGKSDRRGTCAW